MQEEKQKKRKEEVETNEELWKRGIGASLRQEAMKPVSWNDGRLRINLTSDSWRLQKRLWGAPYITFITGRPHFHIS